MYRELLADATFHNLLLACDRDLADTARAEQCSLCGGALHAATYPRKPRGRPMKLGPEHDRRYSFCCAVDGCRSRATPPSLRFLGPKVYLAAIVVLVAIMRHGATPKRVQRMNEANRYALHAQARRTLGDPLVAICQGCKHRRLLFPAVLASQLGESFLVVDLPQHLRCAECKRHRTAKVYESTR